jgi:molybdate transport system substrate-binding protein
LEQEGLIVAESVRVLARFGIGIGVRAGARKTDIGSAQSLKALLLAAASIAHTSEGASGVHFGKVAERLGIAREVKAKAVTRPGGLIAELVVSGDAELAVQQVPELLSVPGIELLGPLPPEFQVISTSAAGIAAHAKQPDGARELLAFLLAPSSAAVFTRRGFEVPAGGN